MASLCHPWFTTTNLSYRFPFFETSATALCGTTGTQTIELDWMAMSTNSLSTIQWRWWRVYERSLHQRSAWHWELSSDVIRFHHGPVGRIEACWDQGSTTDSPWHLWCCCSLVPGKICATSLRACDALGVYRCKMSKAKCFAVETCWDQNLFRIRLRWKLQGAAFQLLGRRPLIILA